MIVALKILAWFVVLGAFTAFLTWLCSRGRSCNNCMYNDDILLTDTSHPCYNCRQCSHWEVKR